jgi:hypothetical protein
MDGRHKYNRVLPGVPRGSLTTLAKLHPSATQPSALCLTPWLRWTIALFAIFSDVTPSMTRKPGLAFGGIVISMTYDT